MYDVNTTCRKDRPNCNIINYIENHKGELEKISKVDVIDEKVIDLVKKIICNSKEAKGRNCHKLGDIIICLDEKHKYDIYSTNEKDFIPICYAIGKSFKSLQ